MATYYNQTPAYRGPVLAEEGLPDFERMNRATERAAALEQDQIRQAGDQMSDRYTRASEEANKLFQAPVQGYQTYLDVKDRKLNQTARMEESALRREQIAAAQREGKLSEEYGGRKAQAEIRQMEAGATGSEAQARLAGTQAKRAEFETASMEKWAQPGSAAKLIPEAQAIIAQYKLPEDISAEEFIKSFSAKLDIDTGKRAQESFKQAQQMFPLQLKQLGQQITLAGQMAKQGQYTFNRQELQDRVGDAATMLANLEAKALDGKDKDSVALYQQTVQSLDPKTRALVDSEIGTRKASKRLQEAIAEPTLDPLRYAGKQKTVEDYIMVNDTAKTVNHLIGLVNQYKNASTLIWDNEQAEAVRGEIAQIAAEAGYPNLSDDILSGVKSGATVETTMKRLISIIGGKALTAARSANAAPETAKMAESIRAALADVGISEMNGSGKITAQGLLDIAAKKRGTPNQGIPAQQTQPKPPGSFQQKYQQQNRQAVPLAAVGKGG